MDLAARACADAVAAAGKARTMFCSGEDFIFVCPWILDSIFIFLGGCILETTLWVCAVCVVICCDFLGRATERKQCWVAAQDAPHLGPSMVPQHDRKKNDILVVGTVWCCVAKSVSCWYFRKSL